MASEFEGWKFRDMAWAVAIPGVLTRKRWITFVFAAWDELL